MKSIKLLTAILAISSLFCACQKEDGGDTPSGDTVEVYGTVKDNSGNTIEGVKVEVRSSSAVLATGTSAANGSFSVKADANSVSSASFSKTGYQPTSLTIMKSKIKDGKIELSPVLEYAQASIKGVVMDARQSPAVEFAGVSVSNGTTTVTTANDGTFEFKDLTIKDYTLVFSYTDLDNITKTVTADMFKDGVAVLDTLQFGKGILRGLSLEEIKAAPKMLLNEYKAFSNKARVFDWPSCYMSAHSIGQWGTNIDETKAIKYAPQGFLIRTRDQQELFLERPKDLEMFDSYIYFAKKITADNSILSVCQRTFPSDFGDINWGVQVVDITEANPQAVLIGGIRLRVMDGSDCEIYRAEEFDLSAYVGKEVVIAIGVFRGEPDDLGTYVANLAIQSIYFSNQVVEITEGTSGAAYTAGDEITGLEGWHLTKQMVASCTPNTTLKLDGDRRDITSRDMLLGDDGKTEDPTSHRNGNYWSWIGTGHVASEWGYMYMGTDPDPFISEGYLLRTENIELTSPDYDNPTGYLYSKFSVKAGQNKMYLRCRNFSSTQNTLIRVTVIDESYKVTRVPVVVEESTVIEGGLVENVSVEGEYKCTRFINENGGSDVPENYAMLVFDLSEFNGKDVMIALSIHPDKGTGDQKIAIYNMEFK